METRERQHDLTAVVTTWNCETPLSRCLPNLRDAGVPSILVTDCGSTDRTTDVSVTHGAEVVCGGTRSFAQARNAALRKVSSPLVLLIDGDWLADRKGVAKLIETLNSNPRCAMVVPYMRDEGGMTHIGHNVRRFPTTSSLCQENLMLHKVLRTPASVKQFRMLDFDHRSDRAVEHPCGSFLLARMSALTDIGLYDERFEGAWMEDVDLAQRLGAKGWTRQFCAGATGVHIGRETIRHFYVEAHYEAYYRSLLQYCACYLSQDYRYIQAALMFALSLKMTFTYVVPRPVRETVLRHYKIYNSDETIQAYRHVYLRSMKAVWNGAS